jgi:hypothetical protein
MPPTKGIPQKCLTSLAKALRQNGDRMKNLSFPPGTTAVTAVETDELRFDVHPSTLKEGEATGIIQANTQATNKEVKKFIKGKSSGHKGTHQVIQKIRFPLGSALNVEALAQAIETPGAEYSEASGSGSGADNLQTGWNWSEEHQQLWRIRADGSTEWLQPFVPEGESMYEWQYCKELRAWYRYSEDGTFAWQ